MKELNKKLEALKKEFGEVEGIILTREAFQACSPDMDHGWKCDAIKIEGSIAKTGWIWWDFEKWVEENGDTDDASNYPWENATADDFEEYEEYDLTDEADISDLMDRM